MKVSFDLLLIRLYDSTGRDRINSELISAREGEGVGGVTQKENYEQIAPERYKLLTSLAWVPIGH